MGEDSDSIEAKLRAVDDEMVAPLLEEISVLPSKTLLTEDTRVFEAIKPLIKLNGETIKASIRVQDAIERFERSTSKTEKVMMALAAAQVLLALVQIGTAIHQSFYP